METKAKDINFKQAAIYRYWSLSPALQRKTRKLLSLAKRNLHDEQLKGLIRPMADPDRTLYVISLNEDLRIVIEVGDKIFRAVDILSMEMARMYFGTPA